MKLRNSLLVRYLLIILIAIMILPLSFPVMAILFYAPISLKEEAPNLYLDGTDIERTWRLAATDLAGASDEEINNKINTLHSKYDKASMFWVDETGTTKLMIPAGQSIPSEWTPSYTVDFMKQRYGGDPFTIVSFIGNSKTEGFMVFQVPRSEMISMGEKIRDEYDYIMVIGTIAILVIFVFMSGIFFYKIRKRLIRVAKAMTTPAENGIPLPISIQKQDEIGQLENAFNEMIKELEISRKREKEEEGLRRQLIANLSHDLRTPLTTIRSHTYSLQKEVMSDKGKQSIELIDKKISYLGQLIENLLSYTLLSSKKYPYNPQRIDVARKLRECFANWYPVFEHAGFEIELYTPEHPVYWIVDAQWFERILDNLFQNINRHAATGKYIGIKLEEKNDRTTLTIQDHGPGMDGQSNGKGAGIGLTIVSLMIKEMNLNWDINSRNNGTTISIWK
ncbi:histidine kinase dimerization/phospho-acceptor domain-containing protein [Cytobacillus sp. FJAT-54145]|uniref:histidine kinase n=1 Tax=Cytobacillus spartinae TaxID=3299023 RepID=A0ABW6KCL1_9BACI